MPRFPRRQISTAFLALCALLSLAFAPSPTAEDSRAGECLHGYAYATVAGIPVGLTSDTCYKPTDCGSSADVGPTDESHGPVSYHHHVNVPLPRGTDVTCYL